MLHILKLSIFCLVIIFSNSFAQDNHRMDNFMILSESGSY